MEEYVIVSNLELGHVHSYTPQLQIGCVAPIIVWLM